MSSEVKYCSGCGVELNFTDPKDIGYSHPKNTDGTCQRCYELINFNKVPDTYLLNEQYIHMFDTITKKDGLLVWIVDIFDFNASYYDFLVEKLQGQPILLVINKVDILPKSVKHDKLTKWVRQNLDNRLNIIDIIITSAIKKLRIDEILEKIYIADVSEVYFIGTTNVGKSTLINKLIKALDGTKPEVLTTSYYAGTTLGIVKVKVNDSLTVYDTPGIVNEGQLTHYLTKESLQIIVPKNELKPITYQLKAHQTLFLTGLVEIDFLEGDLTSFTCYVSNQVDIHRTSLDNAEQIRKKHYGNKLLQVPNIQEVINFKELKEIEVTLKRNQDIFVSGICFIAVKNIRKEVKLKIIVPKQIDVFVRENLI